MSYLTLTYMLQYTYHYCDISSRTMHNQYSANPALHSFTEYGIRIILFIETLNSNILNSIILSEIII